MGQARIGDQLAHAGLLAGQASAQGGPAQAKLLFEVA